MKKYLPSLLLFCLIAHTSWCQDDTAARETYQKAETAYLSGQWRESLQYLQQAETLLGKNTPKVQFLKVLAYEKIALEDINELQPALAEVRRYLQNGNQLPPLHQKYILIVREIERQLPGQATAMHDARVQQKLLQEKLAWQAEARKFRIGFAAGLPSKNWMGTEIGVILGTRHRFWVIGTSPLVDKYLNLDDEFNLKVAGKLAGRPDGHVQKTSVIHVGYYQGIRVLPRDNDWIKPFVGGRALYHGEYSRIYETGNEQEPKPSQKTLDNIRKYGLDPGDFYTAKTAFRSGFSLDIVIGAMIHIKGATLFTGMDVINSKRLQLGVAYKVK